MVRRPADENFVAVGDGVFDFQFHIGEGVEEPFVKREECLGADEVGAIFVDTMGDAVGRKEFGDGSGAALVPDFFEPAFEEIDIGFGHGCLLNGCEWDGTTRVDDCEVDLRFGGVAQEQIKGSREMRRERCVRCALSFPSPFRAGTSRRRNAPPLALPHPRKTFVSARNFNATRESPRLLS
jgi:hypothetical protein